MLQYSNLFDACRIVFNDIHIRHMYINMVHQYDSFLYFLHFGINIFFIDILMMGSPKSMFRYQMKTEHYICFYGKETVFSNFHSTSLKYETLQLNADGKPIENKKMELCFPTAECLYQWRKTMSNPVENGCFQKDSTSPPDGDICFSIRAAATPSHAKHIGRRKAKINVTSWNITEKIKIMREIISLKFPPVQIDEPSMPMDWDPHMVYLFNEPQRITPSVRLLCSGDACLVEMSPYDTLWGTGEREHDFVQILNDASYASELSVHRLLMDMYHIPIPDSSIDTDIKTELGLNLLGRILMEHRLQLRKLYGDSKSMHSLKRKHQSSDYCVGRYLQDRVVTNPLKRRRITCT